MSVEGASESRQTAYHSTVPHLYAGYPGPGDEVGPRQNLPRFREVQQQHDDGDDEQDYEDGDLEGGQVLPLLLEGVAEGLGPRRAGQGESSSIFGMKSYVSR